MIGGFLKPIDRQVNFAHDGVGNSNVVFSMVKMAEPRIIFNSLVDVFLRLGEISGPRQQDVKLIDLGLPSADLVG